jgi:hypothetical protein
MFDQRRSLTSDAQKTEAKGLFSPRTTPELSTVLCITERSQKRCLDRQRTQKRVEVIRIALAVSRERPGRAATDAGTVVGADASDLRSGGLNRLPDLRALNRSRLKEDRGRSPPDTSDEETPPTNVDM